MVAPLQLQLISEACPLVPCVSRRSYHASITNECEGKEQCSQKIVITLSVSLVAGIMNASDCQ